MINSILTPREILVGGGSLSRLPALLGRLGCRRPLLVADPVMGRLGRSQQVADDLRRAGLEVVPPFLDVVEDPTDVSVRAVADRLKAEGCDAAVALGGGSAIDTAKAAAIVHATGEDVRALKVPRIVDGPTMPVIAIPTTAGTGAEVTRAAVVTDTAVQEKMLILGTAALPAAAIVDYELTLTCPFRVTADTGIDALTHALEALVNRNRNPHADAFALSALRLIGANLVPAAEDGENRAAREAMMLGATHAGLAVSNTSTALIHGLSRPIGAFFHVPHGLSNAMVLPLVTRFSLPSAPDRYALAARALGFVDEGSSDAKASAGLADAFAALNERLRVPTLAAFGVPRERYHSLIPTMVEQGLASGTPGNNPRVPTPDEMAVLYAEAYATSS